MPADAMARARKATLACDLFIAVGSSLVVSPANMFPMMARENGARVVLINRDETGLDNMADLTIRDDIGTVLAPFIAATH
jgi:NAD-dependent deacetylase